MNGNYTQQQLPGEIFNSGDGEIKQWNGRAVKVSNAGNGTRNIEDLGDWAGYQAQQTYKQGVNQATSTLQSQRTTLDQQYKDLLEGINTTYQPLINQTTETAQGELGKRGLTPDSTLFQQQVQGALTPVYGQEQQARTDLGQNYAGNTNAISQALANLQAGGAGTMAQLPLEYGSLSLANTATNASAALAKAQSQAASYVPISYGGIAFNSSNNQTINPMIEALKQLGYKISL